MLSAQMITKMKVLGNIYANFEKKLKLRKYGYTWAEGKQSQERNLRSKSISTVPLIERIYIRQFLWREKTRNNLPRFWCAPNTDTARFFPRTEKENIVG
jgi:hypothetical protein